MIQSNNEINSLNYEKLGVTLPSHDEHGTELDIANELNKKLIHDWKQRGPTLICISCPWEHATEPKFKDYLLQGTDENGIPIMKKME